MFPCHTGTFLLLSQSVTHSITFTVTQTHILLCFAQFPRHFLGRNSRLDEIHASVLNFKIKQIDKKIKLRRSIANFYNKNINNKKIILPKENENTFHVYYNYVIRSKKRNKLKKYLSKYGVETKVVYPHPVHRMKPYANFATTNTNLKVTEKLSKEILSLPIYPELKKLELKKIIKTINSFK